MSSALADQSYVPAALPARRVVLRAAPRREPPFDDELAADAVCTGPHDVRLPLPLVRRVPPAPRPAVRRPAHLPDPSPWARRLLVGMIETAGGKRPLHQLAVFLSPSVHRGISLYLERSPHRAGHWLQRGSVRTVRASEPREGVAELCAVIDADGRVRAVAMRLEEYRGRWRCTRLQLG